MSQTRRLVVLSLLALIGGLLAPSASAAGTTTVSFSVSIVGDASTPLNGTVWVWPAPHTQGNGHPLSAGVASLDLPDGDYKFSVSLSSMDGHTRFYKGGVPEGVASLGDAEVVGLSGSPLDVTLAIQPIATLSGTVTNGDGDAMPGRTVLRNRLGSVTSTVTDADGHYDFGYVQPGKSLITANGTGGFVSDRAQLTVPTTGDHVVDLVMEYPSHITGRVTDAETGEPAGLLSVYASERIGTDHYIVISDTTSPTGDFDITGLSSGSYVLWYVDNLANGYPARYSGGAVSIAAATAIPVGVADTVVHDETLTQGPDETTGRSLSGVITDDQSDPLPGISVRITTPDGTEVASGLSDRSGRWGADVGDGEYIVQAMNGDWLSGAESEAPWFPEYFPDAWSRQSATPVTVAGDAHPGLDLTLQRSAVLTVDVRGPGGVTDVDAGYAIATLGGGTAYDQTASVGAGNVLEILLRPGTWKLRLSGQRSGGGAALLPQWYGGGGATSGSATPVTVAPGDEVDGGTVTLPAKLVPTMAPRVKGKAKVGKRLTATKGTWNLMTGTTFAFTWLRGAKVVGHQSSRVVVNADRGKKLKVRVTATNGSFSSTRTLTVTVAR